MSRLRILGIETSCDETAAAVVADGRVILSNIIASQIDIHRPYGGVVPEIAARKHIESISFIVREALAAAETAIDALDAVAVSNGPGLAGALLVGLSYAKALAFSLGKPLIGVHHIEGHICSNYLDSDWTPPFVCLVVSGGHTHLVHVRDYGVYEVLGRTMDDAAGEAFDKVARTLGLPYPGGPQIDKLARTGNPKAVRFPRAETGGIYDFSFSGLKSAVIQYLRQTPADDQDVAASFQQAVIDVLVTRTMRACEALGVAQVALAGGVAANHGLREAFRAACHTSGLRLHMPPAVFCTDNAAMVASGGYYRFVGGATHGLGLNAYPGMTLESIADGLHREGAIIP